MIILGRMQYTQLCFIVKHINGHYKLVLSEDIGDLHGKIKELLGFITVTAEAISQTLGLFMSHPWLTKLSKKDPLQVGNYVCYSLLCP
jgi:hypothetical protein